MSSPDPPLVAPRSRFGRYQFSLRTLLLLFVVLGSSLAVFGAMGGIVFAFAAGLAIFVHQARTLWSLAYLGLFVFCLICLVGLLWPATTRSGPSPHFCCKHNIRSIAQALQAYHELHGCFPPAYIADKNGKPMHSWRVLLLPYLDRGDLYRKYDFTEPWDSPKNKKLLTRRPSVYACPSDPSVGKQGAVQSSYVAVVGPNAAWPGEKSRKLEELESAGELGRTIMLVEVDNSNIAWTEPRDLLLDTFGAAEGESAAPTVSSRHGHYKDFFFTYECCWACVAVADRSVRCVSLDSLSTEDLQKCLRVGAWPENDLGDLYANWHFNWPNILALAVWLLSVAALLAHALRSRT